MEISWDENFEPEYLTITCHNFQTKTKIISKKEKTELCENDADVFIDTTTNNIFFKTPEGKTIGIPDFGPEAWDLLKRLIRRGGEIICLTSENHIAALVCRLRKKFSDYRGYFFVTQRYPSYTIRLNPDRTWIIIAEHQPKQD